MMTPHPETVLAQSETSSVLRAGILDRPRLARFARAVKSFDELDPAVGTALAERIEPGESVRQVIAAPKQAVLPVRREKWSRLPAFLPWELTPDWVLVLTQDRVLVATIRPGGTPVVTATPIADILSFELGKILLQAWVEWTYSTQNRADRIRIYFNAVSELLFRRLLDCLRQSVMMSHPPASDRHLEYLADLPFKFMNIITHNLLLPGEQVQAVVFQPAIWTTQFRFFHHQQAAARALVLTDCHILIAEEELTGRTDHWGLITRFFPRSRIQSAILEREPTNACLHLILEHQGATQTARLAFEPGAEAALDAMLARMQIQ
jgi:hypothetical protein